MSHDAYDASLHFKRHTRVRSIEGTSVISVMEGTRQWVGMTEYQAVTLREKLLDHRARLLNFAARQVEVDPNSFGWITMLAHVHLALAALDGERDSTTCVTGATSPTCPKS